MTFSRMNSFILKTDAYFPDGHLITLWNSFGGTSTKSFMASMCFLKESKKAFGFVAAPDSWLRNKVRFTFFMVTRTLSCWRFPKLWQRAAEEAAKPIFALSYAYGERTLWLIFTRAPYMSFQHSIIENYGFLHLEVAYFQKSNDSSWNCIPALSSYAGLFVFWLLSALPFVFSCHVFNFYQECFTWV